MTDRVRQNPTLKGTLGQADQEFHERECRRLIAELERLPRKTVGPRQR